MKPILSYPSFFTETTLLITNKDGLHNLRVSQIIYCTGDVHTEFHLANGQIIVTATPLKYYEDMLKNYGFFRSHQTYLVNTAYLMSITAANTAWNIVLTNNEIIPLGQKKKRDLVLHLQKTSINQIAAYANSAPTLNYSKENTRQVKMQVVSNEAKQISLNQLSATN